MRSINVGDVVAIRGDLRKVWTGTKFICAYTPEQLVNGKYIKHANKNEIWTGEVEKIDHSTSSALVAGGWRELSRYDLIDSVIEEN